MPRQLLRFEHRCLNCNCKLLSTEYIAEIYQVVLELVFTLRYGAEI